MSYRLCQRKNIRREGEGEGQQAQEKGMAYIPFSYTLDVLSAWSGRKLCSFMHCGLAGSRVLRVFHNVIHVSAPPGVQFTNVCFSAVFVNKERCLARKGPSRL